MARTRRFLPSEVIAWRRSIIPASRDRAHNAPRGIDNRRE
jgi:hypothetical protein